MMETMQMKKRKVKNNMYEGKYKLNYLLEDNNTM